MKPILNECTAILQEHTAVTQEHANVMGLLSHAVRVHCGIKFAYVRPREGVMTSRVRLRCREQKRSLQETLREIELRKRMLEERYEQRQRQFRRDMHAALPDQGTRSQHAALPDQGTRSQHAALPDQGTVHVHSTTRCPIKVHVHSTTRCPIKVHVHSAPLPLEKRKLIYIYIFQVHLYTRI